MPAVSTRGWSHGRLEDFEGPHIETHRIRDADVSELLSIVKDRQTLKIECIVGKPFMTKDKVLCSTISFSK